MQKITIFDLFQELILANENDHEFCKEELYASTSITLCVFRGLQNINR